MSEICSVFRGPERKLFILIFLFTVASSVFFLSCSHRNRLQGYVYYRLNANPTTLDPAFIVDVAGGSIAAKVFDGLVKLDENLKVMPDIAEKWKVSDDGLTYTFSLRNNAIYSNNRHVSAYDVKYSFKRILDPKTHSPNTWVFEKIAGAKAFMDGRADDVSGIHVVDDRTLLIRLETPFSPFLYLLTMSAAYVVPEEEVSRLGPDFSTHPVGTGPFILSTWLQNRELRLEARQGYFGEKAKVKGLLYRIIPEDLTAITEFELGNLDVIPIPAPEFAKYRKDPKWKGLIVSVEGVNTYYVGMNCSRPPFDNVRLRKAINLAIDRRKLLSTFYENRGRLAAGPVPDLLRRWQAPPAYEYNPEEAREIVKMEGAAGRTIRLYITAEQEVVDMAEFIQSYLKKAGLEVKITQLEWSAYKEAINRGEPDMFWLSWWADYPDAEDFLYPLFHSANWGPAGNRARYMNRSVDRLIEQGQAARDEKQRDISYEKAERIIVEEAPWVFFWHKTDYVLRQPWVRDFRIFPVYSIDKGTKISLRGSNP
ncbi:MAG: ABC transporter substrate-binding protein [Nitrospirae bacterium]|nr:ABC transporter substrate-binding protein [Nitrospirota bacterium]